MTKYLATDVGNVLTTVDFDGFLNVLSKSLNISLSEAMHFLERTQKSHDLGLSRIKDELIDHFKIKSETLIDEIMKEWYRCMVPDHNMMILIENLVIRQGVKVAILSNVGEEHTSIIDGMLRSHNIENNVIKHYSCQVGARKPSKIYYQSFIMENPEFKGCLYLDDLHDNLKSAESFGFKPLYVNILDNTISDKYNYYKRLIFSNLEINENGRSAHGGKDYSQNCFDLFDNNLILID